MLHRFWRWLKRRPPRSLPMVRYWHRVEIDGQSVEIGTQTYAELQAFIAGHELHQSDSPLDSSIITN